jgi:hypothetical protein
MIDDAGTLTDESIADAVQRLKVELIGGLGRDKLRALDSPGNGRSPRPVSLELFIDGLHEHADPIERLPRAQVERSPRPARLLHNRGAQDALSARWSKSCP